MLTKLRIVILIMLLVVTGLSFIQQEPSPPQFGDHCVVAPCIFRRADGGPGLRTDKGDMEMALTIYVYVYQNRTEVWIFAASFDNFAKLEIRALTAIETTDNWASLNFWRDGVAVFGCLGRHTMTKDHFLALLALDRKSLSPSLCRPPSIQEV